MIGHVRKNGDRLFGLQSDTAVNLMTAGTPKVGSLNPKSITAAVRAIRIGDQLSVLWHGDGWSAYSGDELIGDLHWSAGRRGQPDVLTGASLWDFDAGTLYIEKVVVSREGFIVNIAGYVRPAL
jgi:hypothetical protein